MSSLDKYKTVKLVIGVPSMGLWPEKFALCLFHLMMYIRDHNLKGYKGIELMLSSQVGSILPISRKKIVEAAKKFQATHILWIDSDQTFPPQTFHRLMEWKKDILAANIATKRLPAQPTAKLAPTVEDPRGAPCYTDPENEKIEQVWRVGMGIMLTSMKVFETLGDDCFEMRWIPESKTYRGEDWCMLDKAELAGFEIWIDHGLSNRVGHIGNYVYDHNVVGEVKENDSGLIIEPRHMVET